MDEDEEDGRERLQGIVIVSVIVSSPSYASSPISLRVGAPRGLAAFPRLSSTRMRMGRPTTHGLPLGHAASIILIYIQWVGEAGQVFGEHEEEESDDLGELVRVATCLFGQSTHQSPNRIHCHRWPH